MSFSIELPDHSEVAQRLDNAVRFTEEQLDILLQKAGTILEGSLKTKVRGETRGTGLTAASIETRPEGKLEYGVGSYTRGHILRFLDQGTGIYKSGKMILIEPRAARALHFWVKETGDEVFAMYCIVNGILPFDFMERTIAENLSAIEALFTSIKI